MRLLPLADKYSIQVANSCSLSVQWLAGGGSRSHGSHMDLIRLISRSLSVLSENANQYWKKTIPIQNIACVKDHSKYHNRLEFGGGSFKMPGPELISQCYFRSWKRFVRKAWKYPMTTASSYWSWVTCTACWLSSTPPLRISRRMPRCSFRLRSGSAESGRCRCYTRRLSRPWLSSFFFCRKFHGVPEDTYIFCFYGKYSFVNFLLNIVPSKFLC